MTSAESVISCSTCSQQTKSEEEYWATVEMTKPRALKRTHQWVSAMIHPSIIPYSFLPEYSNAVPHHFSLTFSEVMAWWFIRPLHIDLRSSALLRMVWRYQHFFLLALLGVSFSDGAKQHLVISNKNMPICITCGFYSCVSYINILSIFQSPP